MTSKEPSKQRLLIRQINELLDSDNPFVPQHKDLLLRIRSELVDAIANEQGEVAQ